MSLTFVANNGTTWPFDGSAGVITVDEDEGIFTIPTDLTIDQRVNGDGGILVNSHRSPRRVVLSFFLAVDEPDSLLQLWAEFFTALASGGELVYDGPNGQRTLRNIVLEGPDRSMTGKDIQFRNEDTFQVSLLALDPWWYGNIQAISGTFGTPTAWNAAIPWNSPIPWNGGASTTISNTGSETTPVTVVIVGASTSVSMSINGVGGWETAQPIVSGAYLTVNGVADRRGPHRGPHGAFAGSDSPIDWGLLTEGSQLFELPAGSSSLVFGASGTDASTAFYVFWSSRHLTP